MLIFANVERGRNLLVPEWGIKDVFPWGFVSCTRCSVATHVFEMASYQNYLQQLTNEELVIVYILGLQVKKIWEAYEQYNKRVQEEKVKEEGKG